MTKSLATSFFGLPLLCSTLFQAYGVDPGEQFVCPDPDHILAEMRNAPQQYFEIDGSGWKVSSSDAAWAQRYNFHLELGRVAMLNRRLENRHILQVADDKIIRISCTYRPQNPQDRMRDNIFVLAGLDFKSPGKTCKFEDAPENARANSLYSKWEAHNAHNDQVWKSTVLCHD